MRFLFLFSFFGMFRSFVCPDPTFPAIGMNGSLVFSHVSQLIRLVSRSSPSSFCFARLYVFLASVRARGQDTDERPINATRTTTDRAVYRDCERRNRETLSVQSDWFRESRPRRVSSDRVHTGDVSRGGRSPPENFRKTTNFSLKSGNIN